MTVKFFNLPYVLYEGDRLYGHQIGAVYPKHQIGLGYNLFWEGVYIFNKLGEWHDGKFL